MTNQRFSTVQVTAHAVVYHWHQWPYSTRRPELRRERARVWPIQSGALALSRILVYAPTYPYP
jgi:hypothetical protein